MGQKQSKSAVSSRSGGKKKKADPRSSKYQILLEKGFHRMGVSLAFLRTLKVPPGANFDQVRDIIMDMTRDTPGNRALVAYLAQNPDTEDFVGEAVCFVSYAWKGGFEATMEALSKHFEGRLDVKIWMDIAMVDQHAAANMDLDFGAWARTFGGSLKDIGKAVIVLTPGENPIAITRSWCCFEWASIKKAGIPFEYCVTPKDVEGLIERMENGMGFVDFNNLFAGINVEYATAFKKSDQEAILQLMREIGLKEVNDIIMLSLKDWLLRVAAEGEKRVKPGTKEGVYLLNAKASLHEALGEYDDALPLFNQALAMARQVQPENDSLVGGQLSNLAGLLSDQGKWDEALKLAEEAFQVYEKALGKDHPDTTRSLAWIAHILLSQDKYDDALPIMRSVLEATKRALGDDHPDVASALNNLAELLRTMQDYSGAEPLYREALALRKKALGDDHPEVAQSLSNLALCLRDTNRQQEARELGCKAYEIALRALGDGHPDIAIYKYWLTA